MLDLDRVELTFSAELSWLNGPDYTRFFSSNNTRIRLLYLKIKQSRLNRTKRALTQNLFFILSFSQDQTNNKTAIELGCFWDVIA